MTANSGASCAVAAKDVTSGVAATRRAGSPAGDASRSAGSSTARTGRYDGIQALRFVAALLVVVTHATFFVAERLIPGYPVWSSGASGVDVFFVISGFVMVVSSQGLIGRPDGWRVFLGRRIARIVPLYWLATTFKLLVILIVPAVAIKSQIDVAHIVKSYLFLPAYDQSGALQPLLGVGWTLNFEMFFYVMFALAMALRVSPVVFVSLLFAGLAALALIREPHWGPFAFWIDTIVLEFVAGMLLGRACLAGFRPATPVALAVLAVGFVGLLWPWGVVPDMARILTWGIPAIMIVCGVAWLEPILAGRVPRPLLELGDASYALYLFHPLFAPIPTVVMAKLGLLSAPLSILASIATSILVAVVVYRVVERPTTVALKGVVERRTAP